MDPIKIGLMGCGMVAGYGHLPVITSTTGLKLHALFDPYEPNLTEAAGRFGNPLAFTDVNEFFRSGIDAVVVTSSAPAHLSNVLAAAEHRKPVLCEKPLSMSDDQSRQMIAAMERCGCPLYVGFTYRFSPAARRIRELVQTGAIGKVVDLRLVYLWDLHGMYTARDGSTKQVHPRFHGRMVEGGPIVDCGVHQIDLARWWLGEEVVRQHAVGVWVESYEAPDHVYLHMDHTGGAHTMVEISFTYGHTARSTRPQFKYELIGTEGLILYDREAERFELRTAAGVETLPFAHEKNFEGMYVAFRDALKTGQSDLLATGHDGLANTQIATKAVEQAIANRRASSP